MRSKSGKAGGKGLVKVSELLILKRNTLELDHLVVLGC